MYDLIKRKGGGQPGNQNARKHGFYSKVLAEDEKSELKNAVGMDGLDQEIAILRIKFRSLLASEGQNFRLINQAAETLGKLYNLKFSLCRIDSSQVQEAVNLALADFILPEPPSPSIPPSLEK